MKTKLILCLALILSGVGLWILLRPSEYQATVRIQIEPDVNASGQGESYDPYFIQTEFEIIQSEAVLGKVVEALNLNVEWGKKYAGGVTLNTLETIELLKRRLNFHPINNTKFLDIAVTDENPAEAAKIANAIAQAYRNLRIERNRESVSSGIKFMKDEYQKETTDIETKQERLEQLRKQLNLTNPEPAESTLASNYPSYFQAKQDLSNEEAIHKQRQAIIDSEKSSVQNEKNLVEIVNPAIPPSSPIGPNRLLGMVLLLCGLVAFVLGFYLISAAKKTMKHKLILCLALVLSGDLFACSAIAQNSAKSNQWPGFAILPPITNANPSIRCQISVRVPTKLKIERTSDTLSETIDTNSFESTNLMVGTNMVTGVESKIYVYPEGESRPANGGLGLSGGLDFNLGVGYWHAKQDGIPLPGKKYVMEMDLAAFETDIPPQHDWEPYGKNYKILWQRTVKQTVE